MNLAALKSFGLRILVSAVVSALTFIVNNLAGQPIDPTLALIGVNLATAGLHAVHAMAQKEGVDTSN